MQTRGRPKDGWLLRTLHGFKSGPIPPGGKLRAIQGILRCGQAHSLGDLWHALGRVQEGERRFQSDLYDTIRWFCQVTGLASGLKVASLVADIVERLPDAAFDPAILSDNHKCPDQALA